MSENLDESQKEKNNAVEDAHIPARDCASAYSGKAITKGGLLGGCLLPALYGVVMFTLACIWWMSSSESYDFPQAPFALFGWIPSSFVLALVGAVIGIIVGDIVGSRRARKK